MLYATSGFASNHIIQAIIIGSVFAFLTANLLMSAALKAATVTVNGWSIAKKSGQPGSSILLRAAFARVLPGVNSIQEAAYWTTTIDRNGHRLSGRHKHTLHFPAGQLPPNDAFWSLTITDVAGFMVDNSIGRHSLGDRSGLVPNADGSIDIFIQSTAPSDRQSNWLPAPTGRYKLMLRVYMPGQAIIDGSYHLPAIE